MDLRVLRAAGMAGQMFTSFLPGTTSAVLVFRPGEGDHE
jgi:hypothetical protein